MKIRIPEYSAEASAFCVSRDPDLFIISFVKLLDSQASCTDRNSCLRLFLHNLFKGQFFVDGFCHLDHF